MGTEGGRRAQWRLMRRGLVVPNWNEIAELQKEIHSPSNGRPFTPSYSSNNPLAFLYPFRICLSVSPLAFRAMEGLYRETISRHEQKFSSLVPSRCDVPRLFFLTPCPRGHCFRPLRGEDRCEIYPRSRVFNVFQNFGAGHIYVFLLGAVIGVDGRQEADDGFSKIK